MQFTGEVIGATIGSAATTYLMPPSLGASLVFGPSIVVGTTGIGGYFFGKMAKLAEDIYDSHRFKR